MMYKSYCLTKNGLTLLGTILSETQTTDYFLAVHTLTFLNAQ